MHNIIIRAASGRNKRKTVYYTTVWEAKPHPCRVICANIAHEEKLIEDTGLSDNNSAGLQKGS